MAEKCPLPPLATDRFCEMYSSDCSPAQAIVHLRCRAFPLQQSSPSRHTNEKDDYPK
jgi:hypothetical protein